MTIAGNFWPRNLDVVRFPVSARYFHTEPGVQILVHSQQPEFPPRGDVIFIHGLEGSSEAGYAQSASQAALVAGFATHRVNLRSCGGTEALSGKTLYHSGLTADVRAVVEQLRGEGHGPIYLVGYSLGGNVALKLAGELGSEGRDLIEGVCAVSTPIDLAACVEQLDKPSNVLYARRFVSRLKDRIRRKEKLSPGLFDVSRLPAVRNVYQFDDTFTAPAFGFGTADRYYATQSARNFLDDIRIPTLVIQAKDDPLIPFRVYEEAEAFRRNPSLELIAVEHGGHLGFLSRRKPRFWLDERTVEWLHKIGNSVAPHYVTLKR